MIETSLDFRDHSAKVSSIIAVAYIFETLDGRRLGVVRDTDGLPKIPVIEHESIVVGPFESVEEFWKEICVERVSITSDARCEH